VVVAEADPVDAVYSAALDRVVVVVASPAAELRLVDPRDASQTSAALGEPPLALGLAPDGLHAVVSHTSSVTVVDLRDLSTRTLALAGTAGGDVAITGTAGRVFAFPGRLYSPLQLANLATGVVSTWYSVQPPYDSAGAASGECRPRVSPDGTAVFRLENSGDEVARYPVPPSGISVPSTYATSSRRAGPWLTEDGNRFVVGTGTVYGATTLTETGGSLATSGDPWSIAFRVVAHSAAARRFLAVLNDFGAAGELRIYDDAAAPAPLETRFRPGVAVDGEDEHVRPLTAGCTAAAPVTCYVVSRTSKRSGGSPRLAIAAYALP
jgi:hypothetical protein